MIWAILPKPMGELPVFCAKVLDILPFRRYNIFGIVCADHGFVDNQRFMDNRRRPGKSVLRLMALFVRLFFAVRGKFSVTNCTWEYCAHPFRLCQI